MTDTVTETESEYSEVKKPVKEVLVVQDQGIFRHTTGDTYDGCFEAKKKDRTARMNGPGVYTTAEGDVYKGNWELDRLSAATETTITFKDTSKYEGYVKDWCYSGPAKYLYPNGALLRCNFVENCPTGRLTITDPNGHIWLGHAEQGYCWFEPVNHFFDMLETSREKKSKKRKLKDVEDVQKDV